MGILNFDRFNGNSNAEIFGDLCQPDMGWRYDPDAAEEIRVRELARAEARVAREAALEAAIRALPAGDYRPTQVQEAIAPTVGPLLPTEGVLFMDLLYRLGREVGRIGRPVCRLRGR